MNDVKSVFKKQKMQFALCIEVLVQAGNHIKADYLKFVELIFIQQLLIYSLLMLLFILVCITLFTPNALRRWLEL